MSEKLEWVFRLFDEVSNPASEMSKKLGLAEKTMLAASVAMLKTTSAIEKGGRAARGAISEHQGLLSSFHDIVEVAYELPQIFGAISRKLMDFGREIIEGMKFKQTSLIALEAMAGTRDKAISIFQGVEDFAWKTGQTVESVMRTTKDLLSSGFKVGEIETLRLLLGDLRIIDPAKADAVAVAIGEIGRRGELTTRQMRMLSNAGIDEKMMWQELSTRLGISIPQLKAMENLSIKSGTAIASVADIMRKKYSGGIAGSLMEKEAQTLPALLSKVRSIPGRIKDELMGFEHGAGGGAFEAVLRNIANVFDPKSESGQRVITSIRNLIDQIGRLFGVSGEGGLFADLSGPNGPRRVEEMFRGMVDFVRYTAVPAMQAFAQTFKDIGGAMAQVAAIVASYGAGLGVPRSFQDIPAPERIRLAQNTLADPNASYPARESARRILSQANVSVTIDVKAGVDSEAKGREIGRATAEGFASGLEQLGIQVGGIGP